MLEELLRELGVRPLINAAATQTPLGGSIMNPNVSRAAHEASQHFFDLFELHAAVGKRLAALTRNEDAMVSGGVASAFYLLTMALLKLADFEAFEKIPEQFPKGKSMVVYKSHCVEYVIGVEQAGVALRKIGTVGADTDPKAELLEAEILRDKPLAVLYVMAGLWIPPGAPPLAEMVRVCHTHGVPLIVDAAAQLPPKSSLWSLTEAGADVVLFSGGKDLCGPSHTGLILGRRDIVSACRELISPTEGVGRFFKIGKEELIGTLVAVEDYLRRDEDAHIAWCEEEVNKVITGLSQVPGLSVDRAFPNEAGQPVPRARVVVDQKVYGMEPEDILADFRAGEPRIVLMPYPNQGFYVNPMTLKPGEAEIIVKEIEKYFRSKRVV